MNLLEEYRKANSEYYKLEKELRAKLKGYRAEADRLKDKVEQAILKHNIYIPYEDIMKMSGHINRVCMIVQYGDGYKRIEKLLFNCFDIIDGKLVDTSIHPPRFKWVRDNMYADGSLGEEPKHTEIKVLGAYNLELDGVPVYESQLDVLWKEK